VVLKVQEFLNGEDGLLDLHLLQNSLDVFDPLDRKVFDGFQNLLQLKNFGKACSDEAKILRGGEGFAALLAQGGSRVGFQQIKKSIEV
jgi:hypothetical protein